MSVRVAPSAATYVVRTGQKPQGPIQYPAIGSSLSKALGRNDDAVPHYVSVSPYRAFNQAAFGPGFLGPRYAALTVGATDGFGPQTPTAAGGYADTYFSITPEQSAASGLPVYRARAGWKNWSAGALAMVSIDGDLLHGFKLIGGGVYRGMLGDFAESPIVRDEGSRSQWMGLLGLGYTF